jgi:predicted glycosyltransferase
VRAIWIDLDNSPHVPLFAPVISYFRNESVDVVLTARDHSQTVELLDLAGFSGAYTIVGKHYGKSRIDKVRGLIVRSKQLVSHINRQGKHVSVAVSHGSRSMVLAARWLKIPVLTMYDYEFTETRLFNRFSTRVLVPDTIPDVVLDEIGIPQWKRTKYPGIKEEVYVRSFQPDPDFRTRFVAEHGHANDASKVLATLRPPATTANYHAGKGEVLFDDLLHLLLNTDHVLTVIVPRTHEQTAAIAQRIANVADAGRRCILLDSAVDALQLTYASDLLISGGGTMNREAVLLGVPVYSIFAGRQGALDRGMEEEGKITFIRDARDLSKIMLEKRRPAAVVPLTRRVEKFVIGEIEKFL